MMIAWCRFAVEGRRHSTADRQSSFCAFQGFRTADEAQKFNWWPGVELPCECRQRVQSRDPVAIPRTAGIRRNPVALMRHGEGRLSICGRPPPAAAHRRPETGPAKVIPC